MRSSPTPHNHNNASALCRQLQDCTWRPFEQQRALLAQREGGRLQSMLGAWGLDEGLGGLRAWAVPCPGLDGQQDPSHVSPRP